MPFSEAEPSFWLFLATLCGQHFMFYKVSLNWPVFSGHVRYAALSVLALRVVIPRVVVVRPQWFFTSQIETGPILT